MTTKPYIPLDEIRAAMRDAEVPLTLPPQDPPPSSARLARRSQLPPGAGRYEIVHASVEEVTSVRPADSGRRTP